MLRMRSLPFQWLSLPMLVLCAVLSGWVNPPMAVSQPKLHSWSSQTESKNENAEDKKLPCLNSSSRCVEQLTKLAIANSFKLQQSVDRITAIERRLAVTEDRIEYTSKKKWTNYISTNPVNIIQNLFGGGGVQRDNIAIANLEVRTADLLAAKAELERQREAEKLEIENKVLRLILDFEAAERKHRLLSDRLVILNQQREVIRIGYRMGRGSTSQILGIEDRRDRLSEQLVNVSINEDESLRELQQMVGKSKYVDR